MNEEAAQKMARQLAGCVKQRRALLRQGRSLRGELISIQARLDVLEEMLRGYSKNEYDSLDLRYRDKSYRRRRRTEHVLKQTKLLYISPESRVTAVDPEASTDLD